MSRAHRFVQNNQIVAAGARCYAGRMDRRWLARITFGCALTLLTGHAALNAGNQAPSTTRTAAVATPAATATVPTPAVPPPAVPTSAAEPSLAGTWTLSAADDLKPDGARVPAYGPEPRGLLTLGTDGRYAVQIFRAARLPFASGDKRRGTPAEYQDAALRMSAHFGRYAVDAARGTITFEIERASFPNWEGTTQTRPFTLTGDELSWRVPATPDGTIPISVWRRAR